MLPVSRLVALNEDQLAWLKLETPPSGQQGATRVRKALLRSQRPEKAAKAVWGGPWLPGLGLIRLITACRQAGYPPNPFLPPTPPAKDMLRAPSPQPSTPGVLSKLTSLIYSLWPQIFPLQDGQQKEGTTSGADNEMHQFGNVLNPGLLHASQPRSTS